MGLGLTSDNDLRRGDGDLEDGEEDQYEGYEDEQEEMEDELVEGANNRSLDDASGLASGLDPDAN